MGKRGSRQDEQWRRVGASNAHTFISIVGYILDGRPWSRKVPSSQYNSTRLSAREHCLRFPIVSTMFALNVMPTMVHFFLFSVANLSLSLSLLLIMLWVLSVLYSFSFCFFFVPITTELLCCYVFFCYFLFSCSIGPKMRFLSRKWTSSEFFRYLN